MIGGAQKSTCETTSHTGPTSRKYTYAIARSQPTAAPNAVIASMKTGSINQPSCGSTPERATNRNSTISDAPNCTAARISADSGIEKIGILILRRMLSRATSDVTLTVV